MILLVVASLALRQQGIDPGRTGLRNPSLVRRAGNEVRRRKRASQVVVEASSSRPEPPKPVPRPKQKPIMFDVVATLEPKLTLFHIDPPVVTWEWYVENNGKSFVQKGGTFSTPNRRSVLVPNVDNRTGFLAWHIDSDKQPKETDTAFGPILHVKDDSGKGKGVDLKEWGIAPESTYVVLPDKAPVLDPRTKKRRFVSPNNIDYVRNVIDIELSGVPQNAKVEYGDEVLATKRLPNGKIRVRIPKDYSEPDASLDITEETTNLTRTAEVLLKDISGLANPYSLFMATIQDYMWEIEGVPGIHAPSLSVFDGVRTETMSVSTLPSTDQLVNALGQPKSKRKDNSQKNFGHWDGSEWWVYPDLGVEFKVRTIRANGGLIATVIEKAALTSKSGGDFAGLSVGDSEKSVIDAMGKGHVDGQFGREELGFRAYVGGGIAFFADVRSSLIKRIEFRRPLSFLRQGLVPDKLREGDYGRIADIDYRTGEITIELPPKAAGSIGDRFRLQNLDIDCFGNDGNNGPIFAEVVDRNKDLVTCRLASTVNNVSRLLDQKRALELVRLILDPNAALTYATPFVK